MIDITKEEFWDNNNGEVNRIQNKKSKVKELIKRNKVVTTLIIGLGLLMTVNTILIYNFFRIITSV